MKKKILVIFGVLVWFGCIWWLFFQDRNFFESPYDKCIREIEEMDLFIVNTQGEIDKYCEKYSQ
jgi:hypothetical protein